MSRTSNDHYDGSGRLLDGYDYGRQAWVIGGRYVRCGHPETMDCRCYGRLHAGEPTKGLQPDSFKKVCAWCGDGQDRVNPGDLITHGICQSCAILAQAEIDAYVPAGRIELWDEVPKRQG